MEKRNSGTFTPSLLGSCLGVIVSFALIALIITLSVVFGSKGETASIRKNSVLHLKLEGIIPEKTGNTVDENNFLAVQDEAIGLQRLCKLIKHAETDPKISGIFLENNSVSMGQATLYAISQQLKLFKESGKFIYSYADMHSQSSYFLCTVADSMFLNPQGMVDLRGYGTMVPYLKNTLDKVGVKMEVFYAGDFKSGSEPFRLEKMSDENRLQIKDFLNDMKSLMLETIKTNRNLAPDQVNIIMNEYGGRSAKRALENKLIDKLCHRSTVNEIIKTRLGIEEDKKIHFVTLDKYNKAVEIEDGDSENKIAIVYLEGEIAYGEDNKGVITKNKYSKVFTKILEDKEVKAVVLRVNSPGGDAFTSEVIWDYIEKVKAKGIPVVASMGDYAASGGYYISCGADYIYCQPNTLTGSIGVFAMFPNFNSLTKDKLGINFDTVKTNDFAVALSPFHQLSEKEKVIMQESVMEIYDLFLNRVSTGRKLSVDSTKVIARGRVWAGTKAKGLGLVDELGGLNEAINKSKDLAKISEYSIVEYPGIKPDFFADLMRELDRSGEEEIIKHLVTPEERKIYNFIQQSRKILTPNRIQTRLPFIPEFN